MRFEKIKDNGHLFYLCEDNGTIYVVSRVFLLVKATYASSIVKITPELKTKFKDIITASKNIPSIRGLKTGIHITENNMLYDYVGLSEEDINLRDIQYVSDVIGGLPEDIIFQISYDKGNFIKIKISYLEGNAIEFFDIFVPVSIISKKIFVWENIPDTHIQHIWKKAEDDNCDEEKVDMISIPPTWYENNGTPMCSCGEDMEYSHTEILVEQFNHF